MNATGRFPLADWIDTHADCRYDLATSGMRGSIPLSPWPARRPSRESEPELRDELAQHLGVAPERVFLSHGASEANAWVLGYLRRETARAGQTPTVRVRHPEYPPLPDTAQALGFRVRRHPLPAQVAVVSRPQNPEGDLWSEENLARFAEGSRHLLVDETFREFADVPSVAAEGEPRWWATGSFTKFYGADEARVGFAIAPPEAHAPFLRYVGLVSDDLAPGSAAMALVLLRSFGSVRKAVRRVVDRNLRALSASFPGRPGPVAPLFFDRVPGGNGRRLAERCLEASVLVCPGPYFGDPRGVRICLTRRNFPDGVEAYRAIRDGPARRPSAREARV